MRKAAAVHTLMHNARLHLLGFLCRLLFFFFFFFSSLAVIRHFSQAAVALQEVGWKEVYPMDFYSSQSLGPWAPNHPDHQPARAPRRQVSQITG